MKAFRIPFAAALMAAGMAVSAQTPLPIPPVLTGDTIDLTLQSGTQSFYPGTTTPTYGANGTWMAPTIRVNKGDTVTLRVHNTIGTSTTIHWHGLHVPAMYDGGPHQSIPNNATWSPRFKIMNEAGTFWYHPHGEGKTDLHVSKGLAGFFLIGDAVEAGLALPRTYGVDDIPVVIQTKEFDALQQVAIAGHQDTALFVNGALNAVLNAPAQVIRLRLLNGSSMRAYELGATGGLSLELIGTDGGLLAAPLPMNRLRLAPGERAEVCLNLTGLQGQTVALRNYGSELPTGVYGAAQVGNGMAILPGYDTNPRNGADFDILTIQVGAPTANPITQVPMQLANLGPIDTNGIDTTQVLVLAPLQMGAMNMIEGPFAINGAQFDMSAVNVTTYLGNKERWRLENNTMIAHPFHVHDVQFRVENVNGAAPGAALSGLKDVVLVPPMQYVEIVSTFEDFADPSTPYMYHCHMLHHEDEGMMGAFLVLDTVVTAAMEPVEFNGEVHPNPARDQWQVRAQLDGVVQSVSLVNATGVLVRQIEAPKLPGLEMSIGCNDLPAGVYCLRIMTSKGIHAIRLVKV